MVLLFIRRKYNLWRCRNAATRGCQRIVKELRDKNTEEIDANTTTTAQLHPQTEESVHEVTYKDFTLLIFGIITVEEDIHFLVKWHVS